MTSKNYELTSKTRFSTYDSTKSTFRITKNGEDKKLHSLKKKLSISINFTGVKPLHIFKNRPSPLISQNMTSL